MNEGIEKIKQLSNAPAIFDDLSKMKNCELKKLYSDYLKFGPQNVLQEGTDRMLSLITYELNSRENRKSFWIMAGLTMIAVGLSIVQVVIALYK